MRKISQLAIIVCICIAYSMPAEAFVFGDTNFSFSGYPEHTCSEPIKPYDDDEYAWADFKYEVDNYKQCIENYIEAAGNDQERINDAADEAVSSFNYFIQSLN